MPHSGYRNNGSYLNSRDSHYYSATDQYNAMEYVDAPRRGRVSRVITIVALIVFVCAACALGYIGYTYWAQQNLYDRLEDENFKVKDPDAITLADFDVDWDALRAINPDVVGWVYVPNTPVSYPIAYREGDDWYYLTNNFSGGADSQFGAEYGSIFLSGVNQPDMRDQVDIIYGHNMLNGEMFSIFADFTDSDVFNAHRYAYVLTPEGNYLLESFAVNETPGWASDIPFANFDTQEEFDEYLQTRFDESLVTPVPSVAGIHKISQVFAFSTCETANDAFRIVTFYYVKEFLPTGSKYVKANSLESSSSSSASINVGPAAAANASEDESEGSLVNKDDVANVDRDAAARTQ